MRFGFSDDEERYRRTLCDFFSRELSPKAVKGYEDVDQMGGFSTAFIRRIVKKLGEAGLIGTSWPREHGGKAASVIQDFILAEELEYHGLPLLPGLTFIPRVLMAMGTDEQKRFFLPKLKSGDVHFFLGYSEPQAGSDLANLQTRATATSSGFVLTGEKLFSSYADFANYGWVAARTDLNVAKHKGISLFIVDMKSPGITVKRHRTISGWYHPAVVFDNVPVPATRLVGELNGGWKLLMQAIEQERAGIASPGQVLRSFDRLLRYCQHATREGRPLFDDPIVRQKLADAAIEVEAIRLLAYQVGELYSAGLGAENEANLLMLVKKETQRKVARLGIELLGPYAQLRKGSAWAFDDGQVEQEYKDYLRSTFAAGGLDITRNIIAIRALGLPR
ncbi:MAG: acyl-CoA dehydrogenase family protein [Chloroflexi bacterium]|nr:acyl-CoA dehydrogenase family protein [Chloroflexota bacterium]